MAIQELVQVVLPVLLLLSSSVGLAQTFELRLGQASYEIELAKTPAQRQRGLMHRQHLSPRQGMLLVYSQAGDYRIWMKNMLIPLWVYWIDANFTVVGMQRLQPCSVSPCPVYSVARDSRYVLELGDYEHPLAPGDTIEALSEY
ncbi:MAG: DUF192 domain-containing protein [Gammaproteobacteria bacterium]|nr:DUF192 domain-containing protein [Gammaproteobacteria bacterium]